MVIVKVKLRFNEINTLNGNLHHINGNTPVILQGYTESVSGSEAQFVEKPAFTP